MYCDKRQFGKFKMMLLADIIVQIGANNNIESYKFSHQVENYEDYTLHGSLFDGLPNELLLKIIDLAAPNRVFLVKVISRVCRKFKCIADDATLWKGNISLEFFGDDDEEQHLETAHALSLNTIFNDILHENTVGLHIRDARKTLYGNGACNRVDITGEHLHKLSLMCPKLKKLSFAGVRVRAWGRPLNEWVTLRPPELRDLEVLLFDCCDTCPDMFRALKSKGFHKSVPNLREFYMTGARSSCMATVLPDMSECEKLERFELKSGCFNFMYDLHERIPLPRGLKKVQMDCTAYHLEYVNHEVIEGALSAYMTNCEIKVLE